MHADVLMDIRSKSLTLFKHAYDHVASISYVDLAMHIIMDSVYGKYLYILTLLFRMYLYMLYSV